MYIDYKGVRGRGCTGKRVYGEEGVRGRGCMGKRIIRMQTLFLSSPFHLLGFKRHIIVYRL